MTQKKELIDYRNCKYLTKEHLTKVISACGGPELDPNEYSKAELVGKAKEEQQKIIAQHGQLYKDEY